MSQDEYDQFLQSATLTVHDIWVTHGGGEMKVFELQALNGLLDDFFGDKRSSE
jgi:hypothetical protein